MILTPITENTMNIKFDNEYDTVIIKRGNAYFKVQCDVGDKGLVVQQIVIDGRVAGERPLLYTKEVTQ